MYTLLLILVLSVVDIIGYVITVKSDKSFMDFKLRKIPFIWLFWG